MHEQLFQLLRVLAVVLPDERLPTLADVVRHGAELFHDLRHVDVGIFAPFGFAIIWRLRSFRHAGSMRAPPRCRRDSTGSVSAGRSTILDVSEIKMCGICGTNPVGPGGVACPECFRRADWIGKNDPYWFMREGASKPTVPDGE